MSNAALTADMNIVQAAAVEIQYLNGDLNIIAKLDDEPNDVGGLTADQLKAKFDEAGNLIKNYINNTLIPAILASDSTEAAREAAEQQRVTNENARVAAEEARQTAETDRVSAETARANAETARQTAETTRGTNESQRVANEKVRVQNEAIRQANETVRQVSENARNDYAAYDPAKSYVPGNKAAWQGSSYLCTVACTGTAPPDAAHWLLIAERGTDGLNGRDGASIVADGLFGFDVDADSGELRLYYTGDTPPSFSISADGHLIYTLDSGVSVDIGRVTGPAGPKGDPGITTMTQAAYDAAVAAGTIDADAWYGVFSEEG